MGSHWQCHTPRTILVAMVAPVGLHRPPLVLQTLELVLVLVLGPVLVLVLVLVLELELVLVLELALELSMEPALALECVLSLLH